MPYKDIEKKREHSRTYYWLNRDKIIANKDNRNKTRRKYYKANNKTILLQQKEWRELNGNKDKQRKRHAKYCNNHKEELAEKAHNYYLFNPDRKNNIMEAKMKIKVDVWLYRYSSFIYRPHKWRWLHRT
jgi:hypothetical protein